MTRPSTPRRSANPLWIVVCTLVVAGISSLRAQEGSDAEYFRSKVEPLLQKRCLTCHSHSARTMEGGLTLDSKSGWATGGDRGPAIVPGDPDQSLLVSAIRHTDSDLEMPPEKKLPDDEIAVLVEWVKRGAPDPRPDATPQTDPTDWWSLRPLAPTELPKVPGVSHPIDAFLSVKRAAAGVTPSPAADRRTVLRRVMYGLHGLPPTPEALAEFEADSREDAYERLIDTLLRSPRYGERWARHWLDTIHFADSHGCEHDMERPDAWPFRDYVIESLNADVPWAQFIREQLAADVFHPKRRVALGFLGAGPLEESSLRTAPVTFAYLDRDDMVTQTMASFASTTANCARCHHHKFDPISREDYYALQAVFAGVDKGVMTYDIDSAELEAKRRPWEKLLEAARKKDAAILLADDHKRETKIWADLHRGGVNWESLEPTTFVSTAGAQLTVLDDASILAGGNTPDTDHYLVTAEPTLRTVTMIRLELLPHDSLPKGGPGRAPHNGNLHLNAFTCQVFEAGAKTPTNLAIGSALADFNQEGWTIAHVLDADPRTAWGIHPQEGKKHSAVFVLKEPAKLTPGSRLAVNLEQSHGTQHVIGRFRLSVSDSPPERADALPPDVLDALKTPDEERSKEQQLTIAAHVAYQRGSVSLAALPPRKRANVYAVNRKSVPLTVNVLDRGDIEKPLEVAQPGTLSAITALEGRFALADQNDEAARRAALANWLASPENPLTWRSVVNRVWHYHFGRGLCDTPNDLGRMGGVPSHPELLDWLALWFRDEAKGSLKALHRLIVTSHAYRQQSTNRPAAAAIDGENRLLWRMNTMRLDAEQYRDSVRQISGRIDLTMGGPGVKHFIQSKGVFMTPNLNYEDYDWSRGDAGRREIYRVVWRGVPDPFMEVLDFPNLGLLAPTRTQTISPLQSLVLINHDFVLYHSQQLADRIRILSAHPGGTRGDVRQIGLLPGGDGGEYVEPVTAEPIEDEPPIAPAHVADAYRFVFQRLPTSDERAAIMAYAHKHGLAATCRLLFNTNEFLYVE